MNAVRKISGAGQSGGEPAAALCLSCGLCCDGSLFWAVELEAGEAVPGCGDGAGRLPQPCTFHGPDGCGIYADRPGQCRAFSCGVLEAVRDGARDRAWGEARIAAMRHLLAGLEAVLPGDGALYGRAAAYLEDANRLPDDARIRARVAVYEDMIGDFRPLAAVAKPARDPS